MKSTPHCRYKIALKPNSARVILRPFIPGNVTKIVAIIKRALALSNDEVHSQFNAVWKEFNDRHLDLEDILLRYYAKVQQHVSASTKQTLSRERKLLIGTLFSGEYALESAALFNPSIVPHPDQTGVPGGGLRFIMSLRATGEGHISSIEFRVGSIAPDGQIFIEPTSRFVTEPEVVPDPRYEKESFIVKLREMGIGDKYVDAVMEALGVHFTRSDLKRRIDAVRHEILPETHHLRRTIEHIQWLADSNYELRFSEKTAITERIIFPVSRNESNGIEDARFVRFIDDDGSVMYFATYTAYNGRDILPQMIETADFLHFNICTLNGNAAQNKGMALFPRRINGNYAMLSRQDDENLFIMFSRSPHHWNDPQLVLRPSEIWESVKIGNCGSPIETDAGWLVITHGVGPMRKYCIGAILLDLEDPTKVIGRLKQPLISSEGSEREGYVPNVVYSCGSLIHENRLILPYAISDFTSTITSIQLDDLLTALQSN
ncbi:MAG: glycoside hydrolase family 130 protein [Pontiellaceae bacterium]|nr:glycoside hydrolase family 130 protein [Pontiellaceae bacterium]